MEKRKLKLVQTKQEVCILVRCLKTPAVWVQVQNMEPVRLKDSFIKKIIITEANKQKQHRANKLQSD